MAREGSAVERDTILKELLATKINPADGTLSVKLHVTPEGKQKLPVFASVEQVLSERWEPISASHEAKEIYLWFTRDYEAMRGTGGNLADEEWMHQS